MDTELSASWPFVSPLASLSASSRPVAAPYSPSGCCQTPTTPLHSGGRRGFRLRIRGDICACRRGHVGGKLFYHRWLSPTHRPDDCDERVVRRLVGSVSSLRSSECCGLTVCGKRGPPRIPALPSRPSFVKSGYCGLPVCGKRGSPLIRSSLDPSSPLCQGTHGRSVHVAGPASYSTAILPQPPHTDQPTNLRTATTSGEHTNDECHNRRK